MFQSTFYQRAPRCLTPPVDIYESDDEVIVTAELPGVSKEQLKVEVVDQELTIQGAVPQPREGGFLVHESTICDYYRTFRLAQNIDATAIEASIADGVLTLTLPKRESTPTYEVPIETE